MKRFFLLLTVLFSVIPATAQNYKLNMKTTTHLLSSFLLFATFAYLYADTPETAFYWEQKDGAASLFSQDKTLVGHLSGTVSEGIAVSERIETLDDDAFKITRQYTANQDLNDVQLCFDFVHHSPCSYWMIPAVSYNGNHFGRGKEPKDAAENGVWRTFSFRRTPIPGITYSEGNRFAVAAWSDAPKKESEDFSCSIMPEKEQTTHRIILPEEEMPTNYFNLNKSKPGYRKTLTLKKGETLTLTMYVNVSAVEAHHTAVRHFLDKAWEMAVKPKIAIPDNDKIWNLAIRYAKESLWKETEKDSKKFSGFVRGLLPDGNGKWINPNDFYEVGWVGRNISLANGLLADFLRNGNEDSKNKGLKVLDSWTEHCVLPNGLVLASFVGFPNRDKPQRIDANNLGGAAADFFEAADLAKQIGLDGKRYEKVAYGICDFIKNDQQPDGQYAREWMSDGKATLREGSICATVIPAMITSYRRSKDTSYLQSAIKGYDFYIQEFHRDGYTTAAALDTWCIDKESAIPLLAAATRLYEETGNRQYRDDAVSLSYYLSQWLWHYQGVYPADNDFTKYDYNTFGATSVSVQHHCLDVYALFWLPEWFKLSELTGDPQWRDKALAIWQNSQQLIGDGEMKIHDEIRPAGSQSESFFHCNYWLGGWSANKENEQINGWMPGWIAAARLEVLRKIGSIPPK
ncbi:hypothetical protein FACS189454_06610 [Planctomycetales bacterium]|nr:hypothetical protein FACS189454_06610 [Planctomycetales bacterium]